LRVALGLGDQELEQRLRPALDAADDLLIVAQCLAADQLLQLIETQAVDALVVAWSLHRLTDAVVDQLERPALRVVLLVPDPDDQRWKHRHGPVLPLNADAAAVREAVLSGRPILRNASATSRSQTPAEAVPLKPADAPGASVGGVIAIAGGMGSPGRTTVAINIAAALGAAEPTVLVEADLSAPAIVAYLDGDPSRNLCTLAHTVSEDPRLWGPGLADELQPLGPHPGLAAVLCGPPKREMRTMIAPALVERLIDELVQRYRWVIVDVGPDLLGTDAAAACHRVALARAHHVVLVTACDLVALWHARTALEQLERLLGIERRAVSLVLNRHDDRFHHSRNEVEWHLGAPVVAVVPSDDVAVQRAISEQRPLVLDPTSRAGRAVLCLAEGMHEGKLQLPAMPPDMSRRRPWWRRFMAGAHSSAIGRRHLDELPQPVALSAGRRSGAS
jgi:MinD-like ATPase involved in chromosome partitioning or flagellar assembly